MRHGLDWTHMKAARGIAGSTAPEQDGIFVESSEWHADWWLRINNTGGPLDLWAVEGIDPSELVESPEGFFFVPRPIPRSQLTLVRTDVEPPPDDPDGQVAGSGKWTGYAANPEHWPQASDH